ncbi:MAG: LCP family protein [Lachnospiraceae bacterium]|nr:LCP family protein [Lachnospiraceae bacterium]
MGKKKRRDAAANLEKDKLFNPERVKRKKKQKIYRILLAVVLTIVAVIILAIIFYFVAGAMGKARLHSADQTIEPALMVTEQPEELTEEEQQIWQEGWVKYNDQIYAYNEDILTFLFMGIDKNDEVVQEVAEGTNGGQADALFLLVLNPHTESIDVIGINRNSMTDIDVYNEEGAYVNTITAQIAVQHGFGNGVAESCEYQVKAVRNLFYQIPIHGYCAINAKAVIPLTDMVGGVELTALEDVRRYGDKSGTVLLQEGETKLLDGELAYSYVRFRDTKQFGSADMRLQRQKQYLAEMMKQVKSRTAKDLLLPVKMYNELSSYMTTNVTADEVAYLSSIALNYHFDQSSIYSLEGETVQGDKFEEFYVDEDALHEMIIDIFYEPVEENGGKNAQS